VIGLFGLGGAVLLGCPVFGGGTSSTGPCSTGNYCPPSSYCSSDIDCPRGDTCQDNYCVYGSPEASTEASPFDSSGCPVCPSGEICSVVDAALACVPLGDAAVEAGVGPDADARAPFTGCSTSSECADSGVGALCLDGTCVPAANQCSDATQCPANDDCVQGACVPTCTGAAPTCPTGYSCDVANGVCTGNPTPCGGADGGMSCTGGTTCVEQHCVPTCAGGDAACGTGLVCVDYGCIPDQEPVFTCNTDGQTGDGKTGDCDVGSICLHHSCYISCDPEASTSCMKADMFPLCKAVTTSGGTYYVCGSNANLGNQCDPTRNLNCTGSDVCIDGYCR
jgi:hypothetical protein